MLGHYREVDWPCIRGAIIKNSTVITPGGSKTNIRFQNYLSFFVSLFKYNFTLIFLILCITPLLQDHLFLLRTAFDLTFFFIVIVIIIQNLIFGVIIDTFAALRAEKNHKEEVLKNTCFICGKLQ